MTHANSARGETEVEIDEETYVLAGTFSTLPRFQAALGVKGLGALLQLVVAFDPLALYEGVKCLAISGDIKKLDKAPFRPATIVATQKAIMGAITGPQEPDAKNGESATEKQTLQ